MRAEQASAVVDRFYIGDAFLRIGSVKDVQPELRHVELICGRFGKPDEVLVQGISGYEMKVLARDKVSRWLAPNRVGSRCSLGSLSQEGYASLCSGLRGSVAIGAKSKFIT